MPNFEQEAKIQIWICLGPAFVGGVFAMLLPVYGPIGILVIVASILGAYFVIRSKIRSKLRTRNLIEWGSRAMLPQERRSYYLGYILLGLAVALGVLQRVRGIY